MCHHTTAVCTHFSAESADPVLSPDDRFARVRTKCQDYLRLGVPESWIFDPESRAAFTLRGDTMTEHLSGSLQHQSLELELGEVFGILDQK